MQVVLKQKEEVSGKYQDDDGIPMNPDWWVIIASYTSTHGRTHARKHTQAYANTRAHTCTNANDTHTHTTRILIYNMSHSAETAVRDTYPVIL